MGGIEESYRIGIQNEFIILNFAVVFSVEVEDSE
jgi:hypothetical protein